LQRPLLVVVTVIMAPMVALAVEDPVAEVTAVSLSRPVHSLPRLLPPSVEAGGDVVEAGIIPS
jgi:hypothetical protein